MKQQEIDNLKYHLAETSRYLQEIETSAFPGLDCALMEVELAQESLAKLIEIIKIERFLKD